ncbi:murein transglycosylase A [Maricaulis maris]|uniref:peptidoglycan lytic exotransglycosylase n=1 Tax=Maricaulis maris TaxID=74318 RepID=A0A495D6I0_9PROT|nr:murein transglycosylase A [Maricaulis maris]RKQ96748.1 membrane-bound lytic murein transglycosylase A [Maricaulis maris]
MSRRFDCPVLIGAALLLASCQPGPPQPEPQPEPETPVVERPETLDFQPVLWDGLAGWTARDLEPALQAFRRSCDRLGRRADGDWLNPQAPWAGRVEDWRGACAAAAMTQPGAASARASLEAVFTPVRLLSRDAETGDVREQGLLTGYYEPYVDVRRSRQGAFTQPLRRRPDDLVTVDLGRFDESLAGRRIVGEVEDGELVLYKDRAEIETSDAGEVFAWGRPVDVFFLQIQGSGRLVFADGHEERAAFAAHNGLPYRSIGRELVQRGELEAHAASKQGIEAWLSARGPEATAELFGVNPRYVFFASERLDDPSLGPRGASGVALTPMASIAVDTRVMAHGVPVWLSADLPELENWTGLVISQDSGGAINGPLRGDFFWGWGETAERRAGTTRAQAGWVVLLPHTVVARLFADTEPA